MLIKNKIIAAILILLGALSILVLKGEATFFLFTLLIGITLIFARENWIY